MKKRASDDGIDQRRSRSDKGVPGALVACRSARRSIWFSSVTPAIFLCPSALQFNRVCGEIRPRYSPSANHGEKDERIADTSMECHKAGNTWQRRRGCAELQSRRGRRGDPAQRRQRHRRRRRDRHGDRHGRAMDERHRRRGLHDDLERQGEVAPGRWTTVRSRPGSSTPGTIPSSAPARPMPSPGPTSSSRGTRSAITRSPCPARSPAWPRRSSASARLSGRT